MSALWNGLQSVLGGVLAFFYGVVPNIGVAIVLLTLAVNVVVFPLTLRQTRSTRAMQEIQPEVEKLRKAHKDDQQELNQAIMGLYKERGVSPAGCFLPMLVQMPIWFALFRVLREPENFIPESSRLADALGSGSSLRFLGMDVKLSPSEVLSSAGFLDALPYLVLLAVVVGTGFLQQKLTTPRNTDTSNQQAATAQKVTKFLPIFFGVISYVWPSGLNLYFATSNMFRTGQQLLIFRIDGRPEPPKAKEDPVEDPKNEAPKKAPRPQGSSKKKNRRRRR